MSKRKTHEEYVNEVSIKNPNVEVIGQYIDAKTKIKHRCLIHNVIWESLSNNILKGKGCKECAKDKNRAKFTKSHDQYVAQVKNLNPNIRVLGNYIDSKTAILHLCKKHNVEWEAMPTNILKGCGCSECKKEKIIKFNLKSNEDYIRELKIKNPNVKLVEKYIDTNTPILHHCTEHNYDWKIAPKNALYGHGCPQCHNERIKKSLSKLHDEYIQEVSVKNHGIKVIGEYNNANTKLLHYCTIHNFYWETTPQSILEGHGCPKCNSEKISKKNTMSHQWYVDELKKNNPTTIAVEQYINMRTPILHKCLIHNLEWITTPSSTLQGCGCIKCKGEKISNNFLKSHEQYVEELKEINPNIVVLEQYLGANIPILHKCLKDGNEWYVSPSSILNGYGCPQCRETKGERRIRIYLDKHHITYKYQQLFDDCIDIKPLPFDFYLSDYNIAIEYDGKQHFEPVEHFGGKEGYEYTIRHDKIKTEYCKNNGILLLRIPYFKYNNIEEELNNFLFN